MKQHTNQWILLGILLISVFVRIYNLYEFPFTDDEFNALLHLDFDSFSSFIQNNDIVVNPSGIHLFLFYWTKAFGFSTLIVQLPFIIFDLLSTYLIYLIGKQWFNETVGLLCAAALSGIQFTVFYSLITIPYISGLLFVLMLIYFLSKLIQTPKKNFLLNGILFVISGMLCTYNHHFSMLLALCIILCGLFLIQRKFLLKYILLGISIALLYIPHLDTFFHQLNIAGVNGWIAQPDPDFIFNYLGNIFNPFYLLMLVVLCISLGYLIIGKVTKVNYKKILFLFILFILPVLIAFINSIGKNEVFQYSVLIFSVTFIFLFILSIIPNSLPKTNFILVVIVLAAGLSSFISDKKEYNYFYQSCYIKVLQDYHNIDKEENNVLSIIQSPLLINDYYTEHLNIDTNFTQFDYFESIHDLRLFLDKNSPQFDKFYLGTLNDIDPVIIPLIREYYPTIEIQKDYYGGTTYLFSKAKDTTRFISILDFETEKQRNWDFDTLYISDSIGFSGQHSYLMTPDEEWGPSYETSLDKIIENKYDFIDVSIMSKDSLNGAALIIDLEYYGTSLFQRIFYSDIQETELKSPSGWHQFHASIKLSNLNIDKEGIKFKTNLWNKREGKFLIDDYTIKLRKGNKFDKEFYKR